MSSTRSSGVPEAREADRDDVAEDGPRAGRPTRRTFTAEFKREIVSAYDAARDGEKSALLRREGLYSSHIIEWRKKLQAGTLEAPPKRGRPKRSREEKKIAALERENAELKAEAELKDKAISERDAALDVLGKGVAFLESLSSKNAN